MFILQSTKATATQQIDFYEDDKLNFLTATYQKDKDGCIDVRNIDYYIHHNPFGDDKPDKSWTGDRSFIVSNTKVANGRRYR